jgi:hypothetical protein
MEESKMIFLSDHLAADLLEEVTELCLLKLEEQEGQSRINFLPAGGHKTFKSTLQLHNGVAFIHYNNREDSTKTASIDFDIPILDIK